MKIYDCEGVTVIEIANKIDAQTAPDLEKLFGTILEQGDHRIICDFTANEYVSSAGLRVFLSVLKRTKRSGGELMLCGIKPGVLEVLNMVGFTNLFEIYDGMDMAVEKLRLGSVPQEQELLNL